MPKKLTGEHLALSLKATINANIREGKKSLNDSFHFFIDAGRGLSKTKDAVGHGEFTKFVEQHIEDSLRSCQVYMQAATKFDALPKAQRSALLKSDASIKKLLTYDKPKAENDDENEVATPPPETPEAAESDGGGNPVSDHVPPPRSMPAEPDDDDEPGIDVAQHLKGMVATVDQLRLRIDEICGVIDARPAESQVALTGLDEARKALVRWGRAVA